MLETEGVAAVEVVEEAFALVDGRRVHYLHAGSGRPLLLLHGLVGSSLNWRQNIGALAEDAEVYALDLWNMGESERVPGLDAGLEATADRIVEFMDALGLAEADVAAHSHGGAVAMMLAARHPERVRRLVLFAPANPFCNLGRHLIRFYRTPLGRRVARIVPVLPRPLQALGLKRMYGNPSLVTEAALEGYTIGLDVAGTIDHVMEIVRRWYDDMAELKAALEMAVEQCAIKPTLLVWGDRDRAVGVASADELQHLLPQSHLMVLPGVGHIPFEELPEICNRVMRDWLRSPFQSERSSARQESAESYSLRRRHADSSTPPMAHGAA